MDAEREDEGREIKESREPMRKRMFGACRPHDHPRAKTNSKPSYLPARTATGSLTLSPSSVYIATRICYTCGRLLSNMCTVAGMHASTAIYTICYRALSVFSFICMLRMIYKGGFMYVLDDQFEEFFNS